MSKGRNGAAAQKGEKEEETRWWAGELEWWIGAERRHYFLCVLRGCNLIGAGGVRACARRRKAVAPLADWRKRRVGGLLPGWWRRHSRWPGRGWGWAAPGGRGDIEITRQGEIAVVIVNVAGSKAAGEELAIGLKNKVAACGCCAPAERCCDDAAASERRIEGAVEIEAQQFETLAVISKRDQLAVTLKSRRLEISLVDHDELATVAKGLIQRTVRINARDGETIVGGIYLGNSYQNDFAVGLKDSIPAMVPVAAKIDQREAAVAECRIERAVRVITGHQECIAGLAGDDYSAIGLDYHLKGVTLQALPEIIDHDTAVAKRRVQGAVGIVAHEGHIAFSLVGGIKLDSSFSSSHYFAIRLARKRVSPIIVVVDVGCHCSAVAESGIDRTVRVETQQDKRSISGVRQVDASAGHDFAVRQNEKPGRALPDVGYGYHFAAIAKRWVERAIRVVAGEGAPVAWMGIANGDDLAVGLEGNATHPVGAAGKVGNYFTAVAKCWVKVSIRGLSCSPARREREQYCHEKN